MCQRIRSAEVCIVVLQLPSRGQVAVTGELDGHQVRTVLEPDGRMGHWVSLDAALPDTSQLRETEVLAFTFTTASTWPEPDVPEDLSSAQIGRASCRESV